MCNDYFTLFEIEQTFNINLDELESKYIELHKRFHPDVNDGQLDDIVNVNKAYEVLKSPLKRAEYMLNLLKIENNNGELSNGRLSNDILQESIEIRERIFDGNDHQSVYTIISDKIRECIKELAHAFATENFSNAAMQVLRLKYLYKSLEEAKKGVTDSNF